MKGLNVDDINKSQHLAYQPEIVPEPLLHVDRYVTPPEIQVSKPKTFPHRTITSEGTSAANRSLKTAGNQQTFSSPKGPVREPPEIVSGSKVLGQSRVGKKHVGHPVAEITS